VDERQTPATRFPALTPFFEALRQCESVHQDVSERLTNRGSNELDTTALFLLGVVKRSLDLVAAIRLLIEQWNYSAMAPLVRLQIDSLLRMRYLASAPDRESLLRKVIEGASFRTLKDPTGQKLTDARLLQLAEQDYPWLLAMYEETSKTVHFTVGHMTIPLVFEERPRVSIHMDVGLSRWTEERIRECLHGTVVVSSEILRLASTWPGDIGMVPPNDLGRAPVT
jgi:hypothetical protein